MRLLLLIFQNEPSQEYGDMPRGPSPKSGSDKPPVTKRAPDSQRLWRQPGRWSTWHFQPALKHWELSLWCRTKLVSIYAPPAAASNAKCRNTFVALPLEGMSPRPRHQTNEKSTDVAFRTQVFPGVWSVCRTHDLTIYTLSPVEVRFGDMVCFLSWVPHHPPPRQLRRGTRCQYQGSWNDDARSCRWQEAVSFARPNRQYVSTYPNVIGTPRGGLAAVSWDLQGISFTQRQPVPSDGDGPPLP